MTGVAGFIGFHLARRLLRDGRQVVGLDVINDYYDPQLKEDRLAQLTNRENFRFIRADVADRRAMEEVFTTRRFRRVIHLAAQAGVRYSIEHPHAYVESNLVGFVNVLEGCRHSGVSHLVYASSSSVYGANAKQPFSTRDPVDHPVSLYAATKKSNELLAHAYSHLYGIPTTGLRFFTVYGPWGRPDMALFLFTRAILEGRRIDVYNRGLMKRDFTFIDDVVEGVVRVAELVPVAGSTDEERPDRSSVAPYRIFNIGNNRPVPLLEFIAAIEEALGRKAEMNLLPMQPGDVPETSAEVDDLMNAVGFRPSTPLREGIAKFLGWYLEYFEGRGSKQAGAST